MAKKMNDAYSRFQIAKKYADFYLHASSGKGFGVHSPFVFDFIIHVLNNHISNPSFSIIEKYRNSLLNDQTTIHVEDFGAGSSKSLCADRKISEIAKHSLKNEKYALLLNRIATYYGSKHIVELGTSLGTTTAYLSSTPAKPKVITLEGSKEIAAISRNFFSKNNFNNITLMEGDFSKTIPEVLKSDNAIDLLFVDGNHKEEPTISYFETFLHKANDYSFFIFDDIHWSAGMERSWKHICEHDAVTMTIDLFFIGIVLFRKEFLAKQSFSLRF